MDFNSLRNGHTVEFLELKPGHFIRVPAGMNMMELSRYRFTGAEILLIAAIAGGTIATVATVQQGRAAEAQGKFQEQIAIRNAQQAQREAEGRRQAAAELAIQKEREGRRLRGRQRALFAKSGVELRGSPLSVLVETAQDIEADRLTILREGALSASSDEFRAGILRAEGSAAKQRGKAAKRASVLSAVGQGLSTAGTVAAIGGPPGTQGPLSQSTFRRATTQTGNFPTSAFR